METWQRSTKDNGRAAPSAESFNLCKRSDPACKISSPFEKGVWIHDFVDWPAGAVQATSHGDDLGFRARACVCLAGCMARAPSTVTASRSRAHLAHSAVQHTASCGQERSAALMVKTCMRPVASWVPGGSTPCVRSARFFPPCLLTRSDNPHTSAPAAKQHRS
jgi:hypothetical protein